MVKILIVDDEATIRKGLQVAVPWEDYGFTVVGTAKNGMDALNFLAESYADIILSDIRMPFMDGLELMQAAHKKYPHLPFIFISGYDEFQYVQKALNCGAFAYILKPIDTDELLSLLKSAQEKFKLGSGDNILKRIIQKNFFLSPEQWDFSGFDYLKDTYLNNYFCSINLRLRQTVGKKQTNILSFIELTEENLHTILPESNYALIDYNPWSAIYCLYNTTMDSLKQDINQFVNYMYSDITEHSSDVFGVWIGGLHQGLLHVIDSYVESFDEHCFQGMNRYESSLDSETHATSLDALSDLFATEDNIVSLLLVGNLEQVTDTLMTQRQLISDNNLTSLEVSLYLRNLLYKYISGLKKSGKTIDVSDKLDFLNSFAFQSTDQLFDKVLLVIQDIISMNPTIQISQTNSHIVKAKRYVEENYANPYLSLVDIAQHIDLNPSYLSAAFTKEVGICFTAYLTEVRIEKAKVHLVNTNKKIIDISFDVGYMNSTYFSTLFKKATGMTPSKYRNSHQVCN